ncbi:MAG: FAD-dependent oxidoreductase [Proteobacteria bacterium]|nr:FAD-dependent oxidoreductase [Pseudomonadota bacterium]
MSEAKHCVAVIGGATAGAEVAAGLAAHGALVVVFEQNPRPYGKIEDGLPRWHVALRKKEYGNVVEKLGKPGVHFVPNTKIGRDVDFGELVRDWGFGAVVLANGAWRDRPLPLEGADEYVGRGLVYQNPFIIWFNHADEAGYDGPRFVPEDGVLVVGGGLASIDVAKALMLERTRAALAERGIEVDVVQLEVKGIPKILKGHDLAFEDLGIEPCTIFYRRDLDDMPVVEIPEGAPPERAEKVRNSRRRLLEKAMDKYRFRIEPLCMPDGLLVEDDRLVGLRFRRTRMENGRPVATDETFERRGPYVVSSIGSIPEAIPGIEMKGELFAFTDWDLGRLEAHPTVFAAGNVVTGKGNIVASRKHASFVEERLAAEYLGLAERTTDSVGTDESAQATTKAVDAALALKTPAPAETVEALLARVRARQDEVGYGDDVAGWLERVTPDDLQ